MRNEGVIKIDDIEPNHVILYCVQSGTPFVKSYPADKGFNWACANTNVHAAIY